ncbi:hypothetical protein GLYMA_17G059000v4 [Glycine max]|uniref:Uncharacterized protein n=2 Tax=Glycine subgen. Soja TaxID=1462606 RepID=A0A0R0FIL1_SOYBN|nr:hypothetical protein JHK84_046610 [Glycine max]KAH1117005.1 hypothetical protein GYH30_046391 [Glycine max]KRH02777.1 hypothetical protein GLYMA_17G059000v4 [Glycine max]RZB55455.1 hypothetical protein D0Y65_045006 [Glycine soja]
MLSFTLIPQTLPPFSSMETNKDPSGSKKESTRKRRRRNRMTRAARIWRQMKEMCSFPHWIGFKQVISVFLHE